MNKAFKTIAALACIALASFSCQKIEESNDIQTSKVVNFSASALETRTAFGTPDGTSYPTLWTANDEKVKVSLNYASSKDAEVTPSADFKTANFSVEIVNDETNAYTFYSVSPASAAISINSSYKSWNLEVPTAQKPSETSVDEKAQILLAQTEEFTEFPTSVKMNYSHFTAYGKMSLLNLELGDATINSISLTSSKNWAGRWYFYPETGEVESQSGSSATITLETSATESIWFACAPVDLSGETIKVTVNTTNGPLVKEITLPANTKFESGVINKFAVDMKGIGFEESKVYSLVTDLSTLTADSEVIIVAANANVAMSTAQNASNRGQASVTKSDNTITDPGDDVQVFTLKEGSVDNTIAFYTGSGYIYAASSSSNQLKTQDKLDANASFDVELADGEAVLTAQGANARNILRYNASNGLFSCYASGQDAVSIYKLDGSGTDTPLIIVDNTEYTITVADAENGTVEASATTAKKGTEITLTITPAEGYALKNVSVLNTDNEVVFSTEATGENVFIMPASNVTVYAEFEEKVAVEWVKKSISELAAGDIIVIVDETSSTAMSNNNGTSSAPSATSVSIANDKLTSDPSQSIQWVFGKTASGEYQFQLSGTTNYLYATNTNNGLRVGTNSNNLFVITDNFLQNKATSRYVGVYNVQDWRCYTTIHANIAETSIAFYVKTTN
ncbi:MAG: hypothetical protein IJK48_09420 [Bacteroidales bacterium]|nr:hypothetical protein [Bacteroidales bacterium]